MNKTEANKTSVLLRWITGTRLATGAAPTGPDALHAALFLAVRVHKALSAGLPEQEIVERWPDVDPRAALANQLVVEAAIEAWEAGHVDPHDALVVIRDQLRGKPIAADPEDIKEGRWELP